MNAAFYLKESIEARANATFIESVEGLAQGGGGPGAGKGAGEARAFRWVPETAQGKGLPGCSHGVIWILPIV